MILVGRIQEYTGDYPTSYYDISRTDTGVYWRSSCFILGYQQAGYSSILEIILLLLGYQQDRYWSMLEIILLHTRISVGRIQEYILEIILLLLGYQQDGYRSILKIILLHTRISVGRIQECIRVHSAPYQDISRPGTGVYWRSSYCYQDISRTHTGVYWRSSCSILSVGRIQELLEIILLILGYQYDGYRSILKIILLHTRISVGWIQEYT